MRCTFNQSVYVGFSIFFPLFCICLAVFFLFNDSLVFQCIPGWSVVRTVIHFLDMTSRPSPLIKKNPSDLVTLCRCQPGLVKSAWSFVELIKRADLTVVSLPPSLCSLSHSCKSSLPISLSFRTLFYVTLTSITLLSLSLS